jgi:uncharacterized DUF497 family protein
MFEWDPDKARANRAKHGIDFADVKRFEFADALEMDDTDMRADGEPRTKAVGFIGSRLHVLIYTERKGHIRVISLRRAENEEKRAYERYHLG